MEAKCLNEDCEKGTWRLRKHPSEYARGGPSCPECGTSRVEAVGGGQAQQAQQPQEVQQAQQPQESRPAPSEPGGEGGVPAKGGRETFETGMELGDAFYQMQSGDEMDKAQAKGKLLETLGAGIAHFGQQTVKEKMEQRERAKSASDSDISVAEEYPTCPECSAQLKGIPGAGEFQCPSCGVMLEFRR